MFDIEDGKLLVTDASRCMFCNECTRTADAILEAGAASGGARHKAPIRIGKDETSFTFTVETVGSLAPDVVVQKALGVLLNKLKHLLHELGNMNEQ